jgi:hypothetical protein
MQVLVPTSGASGLAKRSAAKTVEKRKLSVSSTSERSRAQDAGTAVSEQRDEICEANNLTTSANYSQLDLGLALKNKAPTPVLRKQYHFRTSERGLLAWDVGRLIELSKHLPVREVPLSDITELDEPHWYRFGSAQPTCRSIVEHCSLIADADLSFPIVLDSSGKLMDGMHRVCKALLGGAHTVRAVQFVQDPLPDHVGVEPDALPYK